jgi:hypothetical protein
VNEFVVPERLVGVVRAPVQGGEVDQDFQLGASVVLIPRDPECAAVGDARQRDVVAGSVEAAERVFVGHLQERIAESTADFFALFAQQVGTVPDTEDAVDVLDHLVGRAVFAGAQQRPQLGEVHRQICDVGGRVVAEVAEHGRGVEVQVGPGRAIQVGQRRALPALRHGVLVGPHLVGEVVGGQGG